MLLAQETIDWRGAISDGLSSIGTFVPKLFFFLLILLIGRFVAGFIRKLITRGLKAVKFDDFVDRAGIGGPLERAGYADSGRFVAKLIYYLIMLLVLQLALGVFGPNAISDAIDDMVAFIPRAIVAIAIIIITGMVANAVKDIVSPMLVDLSYGSTLAKVIGGAIWVIGGFAALDQLGFAEDIVDTLFTALVSSLAAILILKFGIGGIWAARDRFWPSVYNAVQGEVDDAKS